MKSLRFWILLIFLQISCRESDVAPKNGADGPPPEDVVFEPTIYKSSLDPPKDILLNATGYNPRNFIHDNPWTNTALDSKLQLGLVNSEANVIRYPGGTFGNFWNYRAEKLFQKESTLDPAGWVDLDKVENTRTHKDIENNNAKINSLDDLKFAAKGGTSGNPVNVVFVMNMVTPGADFYEWKWGRTVDDSAGSPDWYAMLDNRYERFKEMLLLAKGGTDPIDLLFIELGNEYYFPHAYSLEAFPTGADFGLACNYIADKLMNDTALNLPNTISIAATASAVGGSGSRIQNWNSSLETTLDKSKVGYVTLHVYKAYEEPTYYSETTFQEKLVKWDQVVNQKFINSGAEDSFLSKDWQVWYTETNANWDASVSESTPSSEFRWAQSLVDAYSVLHLYDRGNAAMVLQFQFNNQVIPGTDGLLYNRAKALIPFMKASKGATSAAQISFASTTMPKLPGSSNAVVQGYCFTDSEGEKKCVIINLSATVKHIDLDNVFTHVNSATLNLEAYNNPLIAGTGTPDHYNLSFAKSQVKLRAYSVNYVYTE
ncbi:MAG: hypothetical protein WD555_00105 [Fulvivirga sp.]